MLQCFMTTPTQINEVFIQNNLRIYINYYNLPSYFLQKAVSDHLQVNNGVTNQKKKSNQAHSPNYKYPEETQANKKNERKKRKSTQDKSIAQLSV